MTEAKSMFQSKKIEDILLAQGLIKKEEMTALIQECQARKKSLIEVITEKNLLDETTLYKAMAAQHNYEFVDLRNFEVPRPLYSLLPVSLVKMQNLIPVKREANILTIATADPSNFLSIQSIRMITGLNVRLVVAQKSEILRLKSRILKEDGATSRSGKEMLVKKPQQFSRADADQGSPIKYVNINEIIEDLNLEFVTQIQEQTNLEEVFTESKQRPVIAFVNKIIIEAVRRQSSDVHIERTENACRIRFRIDGELYDLYSVEKEAHNSIVLRIKVISNLDITEKSMPQDGSFKLKIEGEFVDFRVSIFPSIYGQNVVIRVLNRKIIPLDVNKLGFLPKALELFREKINKPYGMVLVTGPTGSGKTTTLYSSLMSINDGRKKIMTIEDPVEFQLEGINQTQVFINKNDPAKSLTFARGLRSILRQDPDAIMIGEIRDPESAEIAINASLTGHLVFSTVHANHSIEIIARIKSLGVDVNLFMDSVNVVVAQRLVRKICPNCKTLVGNLEAEFQSLNMKPFDLEGSSIFKGTGCDLCSQSGYLGRIGIFEIFNLTDTIKENISSNQSIYKIKKLAMEEGLITLRSACIEKITLGETTLEELKTVSMED